MPLHNGVEFLQESVLSIVNQTYTDWELIIGINGLSQNKILRITKKIKYFKDRRIKLSVSPQAGKCRVLNKLKNKALYNYICLIDVDDLWMPDKLEEQLKLINKYDVIGSDAEYFGDKEGSPGIFLGELSKEMFSWQNPILNSTVMMKKEYISWDENWEGLDDYNLWIDLLSKNKTFYNVPKVLMKHRLHDKSFFNNKNNNLNKELVENKIKKLTDAEKELLADILENKKWKI